MAEDIKIEFDPLTFEGDIAYQNGDLTRESGLSTAVMISLFTDRHADDSDIIDDPTDKRGWWGDLCPDVSDNIGSKLWQYERSKSTTENINAIKKTISDSLQWMIDDQVAKKIDITAEKFGDVGNYRLGIIIQIHKSSGGTETIKFNDLWEAM